jgi:molybdopterin converting factor small subunit
MAMKIHFKFYGVFKTAAGTSELVVEVAEAAPTVRSAISQLVSEQEYGNLKQLLFEDGSSDPRPNALIMLSGREINTMGGLETTVNEKDELALLPIAHGG